MGDNQSRPAAPHLREFFKQRQAYGDQDLHDEQKATLRQCLEKSFNLHDANKNGTLDADEAAIFFTHVIAEQGDFLKAVTSRKFRQQLQSELQQGNGESSQI